MPQTDWFILTRTCAAQIGLMLRQTEPADKLKRTGERGEGGDMTLEIDAAAERIIFDNLAVQQEFGERFTAVSEERGEVDFGSRDQFVVIDPLDGSLNAKRGVPQHAMSIAVADGPTMADVFFGYVYDFGTGEEWVGRRGGGSTVGQRVLDPSLGARHDADGRLELLGVESADPRLLRDAADGLADAAHRLRAVGSIAIALCQVADGRTDAMLTLKRSRAVDTAAGQLIVREAGGHVRFAGADAPLAAPLDTAPHFPILAARAPETLDAIAGIPLV